MKVYKSLPEERIYKAAWHAAIAAVGLYELSQSKSTFKKILSLGLIAFHADAAICDAIDCPTTPQRILQRVRRDLRRKKALDKFIEGCYSDNGG